MLKECVVIVEPEGAGVELAAAFRQHDIVVVGLTQTTADVACTAGDEVNAGDADLLITLSPDIDVVAIARQLTRYAPLAVVPGSERGVPLADGLSQHLGLASNAVGLQRARYDKYAMAKATAAAGLRIPWQACIADDEDLQRLLDEDMSWPVVIKPVASMGSEGVMLCEDAVQLKAAFQRLRVQPNRLGRINQQCLVQRFLHGTEYAVDTVSVAGCPRVCAIWRYRKCSDHILGLVPFTSKQLVPAHGAFQEQLLAYARPLLDAVGIRQGPAHMELLIDEQGVQLMELGARLHGGIAAMDLCRRCIGRSQTELCAAAYADPEGFSVERERDYELSTRGEIVLLLPKHEGLCADQPTADRISRLPGVVQLHINGGGILDRIAGMVMLQHRSQEVIDQTRRIIRGLEETSLYRASSEFTVDSLVSGP